MKFAVFVDVQNDFVKNGVLAYNYPVQENTSKIIRFAKDCRSKGWSLFATADTHQKTTYKPDLNAAKDSEPLQYDTGYLTTLEGRKLPIEHCLEGSEGQKIVEGLLKDENGDVIIPKGHVISKSTFGADDLADAIYNDSAYCKDEPLDEIVVCGYCTSICVLANAVMLRARFPNVPITVRGDLCGDVDEESHKAALKVLEMQQIDVVH